MSEYTQSIMDAAAKVRMLILDVDGVLTDGGIILDDYGNEYKRFNVRDGHGIKLVQRHGVTVAIITGRGSRVVAQRARELGIAEVHQRALKKAPVYEALREKYGLRDDEIAYVGDDVVDIPILRRVGLPVCVADAAAEVAEHVLVVTQNGGGHGAVREVSDLILKAKGLWQGIVDGYCQA